MSEGRRLLATKQHSRRGGAVELNFIALGFCVDRLVLGTVGLALFAFLST